MEYAKHLQIQKHAVVLSRAWLYRWLFRRAWPTIQTTKKSACVNQLLMEMELTSASKQVTIRALSFTPTLAKSFRGYDCIPPPIPVDVDPEVLSPVEVPWGVKVIWIESSIARNQKASTKWLSSYRSQYELTRISSTIRGYLLTDCILASLHCSLHITLWISHFKFLSRHLLILCTWGIPPIIVNLRSLYVAFLGRSTFRSLWSSLWPFSLCIDDRHISNCWRCWLGCKWAFTFESRSRGTYYPIAHIN